MSSASTRQLILPHSYTFKPADISGLWLELEYNRSILHSISPDVEATNGQTVRKWVNIISPGTLDVDQSNPVLQPIYVSSTGSISFNNNALYAPLAGNFTEFCFFVQFIIPSAGFVNGRMLTLFKAGTGDDQKDPNSIGLMVPYIYSGTLYMYVGYDTVGPNAVTVQVAPPFDVLCTLAINFGPTTLNYRLNGVDAIAGGSLSPTFSPDTLAIGVGNFLGPVQYAVCSMYRVLFYNRALTTNEMIKLETWATL